MVFHGTKTTGAGTGIRVELIGCAKRSRTSLNACSAGDKVQGVLRKLLTN